ncbi:AT-rich interactive domain-containing protein 5B, partial [Ophiophagus hannah]
MKDLAQYQVHPFISSKQEKFRSHVLRMQQKMSFLIIPLNFLFLKAGGLIANTILIGTFFYSTFGGKKRVIVAPLKQGSRALEPPGTGNTTEKVKCESRSPLSKTKNNNSNCKKGSNEDKSKISVGEECRADEQAFLVALYKYMKERKTPIERIPYLGFKQINLWTMFQAAQKLGGYETITARRQWKHIYDELGGNPGSTSAATCTRRHYESRKTKGWLLVSFISSFY